MHLRFEVMGSLSASFLSTETLPVLNLSGSGVLVEGTLPLPVNAEYRMQLVLEDLVSEVTVKVRRIARTGEGLSIRYRMGLEFLATSEEAIHVINQIVTMSEADV